MSDEKRDPANCEFRPTDDVVSFSASLARSLASIVGFTSGARDRTAGQTYIVARALELAVVDLAKSPENPEGSIATPGHEACVEEYVQRVRAEIVRQARAQADEAELAALAAKATQSPGAA